MRCLVVVMLVACSVMTARADSDDISRHIVFVGNDPELHDALEDLLWADHTGVKSVGDRPTPPLAELGSESRQLADANGGIATVWLSPTPVGATLVTYERSADRFVVREIPYQLPLTATQAAETARMARVMLRAVRDADDETAVTKPLRLPPPPRVRRDEPAFVASIGAGVWLAAPETTATPLATLALAWRPDGLGAAVTATVAPITEISTPSFMGDVRVSVITATVRRALSIGPRIHRIRVTPGAGLALHVVSFGGQLAGAEIRSRRYDPAVQLGTQIAFAPPGRLEYALAISGDILLRRQVYASGNEQLLAVPRFQAMIVLLVGLRL